VIVAHAREVRLIGESRRKDDDRIDAQTLARAGIGPRLLCPVQHRSRKNREGFGVRFTQLFLSLRAGTLPLFSRGIKSIVTTAEHNRVLVVEVRSCQKVRADRRVRIGGAVGLGTSTGLSVRMGTGLSE
jgi:hypothetical protein